MIREIPFEEWPPFLEQFSRDHRAWLATVERVCAGAPSQVIVLEKPLGAVRPEIGARRLPGIGIHFQEDSRASGELYVNSPMRLLVDETEEGATRALEIETRRGELMRIRFRVAAPHEMLDGIAPGEL